MTKDIATLAVFDFDGTITTRDTLPAFIKFAKGSWRYYLGILWLSPMLAAYKIGIIPNWKAKQSLFSHFFKGMPDAEFKTLGERFADCVEHFVRPEVMAALRRHMKEGHRVCVVSASIRQWVEPWCLRNGVSRVIATRVATDNKHCLTGRFASKNCYGQEKVNRLRQEQPDADDCFVVAYGDSRGDREMFAYADEAHLVK